MTEQPGNYPNVSPTAAELKADCHRLIEIIARRPGYLKLLAGARAMLATLAAYKAGRGDRFARPP